MFSDLRSDDFSLPSSRPLFIELKFLTIKNIFTLRISEFVYKCVNKIHPSNFQSWFQHVNEVHNFNTRSSSKNNLYIPQRNTSHYGLKSIKFHGSKIWNQLSVSIRNSNSINIFVKILKSQLTMSP